MIAAAASVFLLLSFPLPLLSQSCSSYGGSCGSATRLRHGADIGSCEIRAMGSSKNKSCVLTIDGELNVTGGATANGAKLGGGSVAGVRNVFNISVGSDAPGGFALTDENVALGSSSSGNQNGYSEALFWGSDTNATSERERRELTRPAWENPEGTLSLSGTVSAPASVVVGGIVVVGNVSAGGAVIAPPSAAAIDAEITRRLGGGADPASGSSFALTVVNDAAPSAAEVRSVSLASGPGVRVLFGAQKAAVYPGTSRTFRFSRAPTGNYVVFPGAPEVHATPLVVSLPAGVAGASPEDVAESTDPERDGNYPNATCHALRCLVDARDAGLLGGTPSGYVTDPQYWAIDNDYYRAGDHVTIVMHEALFGGTCELGTSRGDHPIARDGRFYVSCHSTFSDTILSLRFEVIVAPR